jgi:hypothetical protein
MMSPDDLKRLKSRSDVNNLVKHLPPVPRNMSPEQRAALNNLASKLPVVPKGDRG